MGSVATGRLQVSVGDGELLVGVRVVPGAAATELRGIYGDRLKVAVAAPAEKGRANDALLAALGRMFGRGAADVRLRSGHAKRDKVVAFSGITETELNQRVAELLKGGGADPEGSQEGQSDGP